MRLANLGGRATLVVPGSDGWGVDLAAVPGGTFGPDVQSLYEEWDAVRDFVAALDLRTATTVALDQWQLRAPVPAPPQASGSTTGRTLPSRPWTCPPFRPPSPGSRRASPARLARKHPNVG